MKRIWAVMQFWFVYGLRFRLNKVHFLRHLGVRIGHDCSIYTSVNNFGSEPWLIEIGNNVTITAGVLLVNHDAASRLFRASQTDMNSKYGNRFGTICIRDNCFIGVNSILLPGVNIGMNSIVGAGSVVTRDVAAGTVVAGNPARVISSLEEYIERYRQKMIPVSAQNRESLRQELAKTLWGEER